MRHPLSMTFTTKPEWLDARRHMITASDTRAILGLGFSNESPLSTWESKVTGTGPYTEDDIGLQIGILMEEPMREICRLLTGVKPKKDLNYRIRIHPEHHWMGATLDAWTYEKKTLIPYEFKDVGSYNAQEWADDNVPLRVQVQVQHQIAVCCAPHAYVMGWIKGQRVPLMRKVERDDEFIEVLIPVLEQFYRWVERHEPPPLDSTIATSQSLYRLHPDDNGRAVPLPMEAVQYAEALAAIKERIKDLEKWKRRIENEFKLAIGHNTAGVFPDGSGFSWKSQERREHVVKASKSRVFRRFKSLPKGISYDESAKPSVIHIDIESESIEMDSIAGGSRASEPDAGDVDGGGPVSGLAFDGDAGSEAG